jgi:hypothetical protein
VILAFALLLAQGFSPVILFAQDEPPDPFKTARFRFGPLALNPTIAIRDVGIDGNVFNELENPKSDFTATVAPGTAFFLRVGRGRLTGNANVGYVFFKEYANERAVNTDTSVRAELPLIHVRPYIAFSYLNTRERPGYEIDARARHQERGLIGGVDLPVTRKATFGISARRTRTMFAGDAVFLGTYLQQVLDRDVDTLGASARYRVTPLTTLVFQADAERDRFRYSPIRNSNSLRVMPGVEFSPFALVNGSAHIGYRKLNMLGPGVPDYTGVVASVELGYTVLGATRFGVSASRDVFYSYEIQQPYYLQTGLTLTATQHVAGPWDVQARWNGQRLEYRQVATAGNATGSGRTDRVTFYGGGIGYRLGHTTRLGLNLDAYRRRSPLTTREYRGFKVGSSLTYGF